MITSISTKVDHVLKLIHTTERYSGGKTITTTYSFNNYKFNPPAEFSNFSYDMGGGVIIKVK